MSRSSDTLSPAIRAARWSRALAVTLLAAAGACTPSNCQMTPTVTRATCNAKTPGDTCPAMNADNQPMLRVCIKQCKPVVGRGQPCNPDLCAPGGNVCDRNLACAPDASDPQKSTCQTPPGSCDPGKPASSTNGCAGGTHCVPLLDLESGGHCPLRETLYGDKTPATAGLCTGFVPEGYDCDGNWDEATRLPAPRKICAPCEPGTQCVGGTCRRACDAASPGDSCPCDDPCKDGYCLHCAKVGDSCQFTGSTKPGACCNAEAVCDQGTKKCCVAGGGKCGSSAECCGTDRCSSGQCRACVLAGQPTSAADLCCPGLTFQGGKCVAPCTVAVGAACTVPGALGECAKGVAQGCAPDGTVICVATQGPKPETCDGKDNDCDNQIDDGVGTQACECGGTKACRGASGWGSCAWASNVCTPSKGGQGCGWGYGGPCNSGSDCQPNLYCDGTNRCAPLFPTGTQNCNTPACWLPSDLSYERKASSGCYKVH